jgi:hypothetical protein
VADALELFSDVELGVIKVDLFPGQAKDFTSAQAEDEDQDKGCVERFTGMPGRFKAARRAARAAATARSPSLPLALPLQRRQRRSAGAKDEMRAALHTQQVSYVQAGSSLLPLPGLSGAGQNLSRPSVSAGQPHPSSCLVNVHAKTALTEPARTRIGSYRKQGHEWPGTLDT